MSRAKITYHEKYKKGALMLREDCFPILKHLGGFLPRSVEIMGAGAIEQDGERLEFQDIRIVMKDTAP